MANTYITGIIDDPADSLFTYGPSGGWDSFYSPYFVPQFDDLNFENDTVADYAQDVRLYKN